MSNEISTRALLPQNLDEALRYADMYSKSGMIPKEYQGKPANVLVAISWGFEVGVSPLSALRSISLINGKPAIWGDALLGICQNHPQWIGIDETSEGEGEEYTAVCVVQRQRKNGEVGKTTVTFSHADAKRANLLGKSGPWQQYPTRMMRYRARGFALRDSFADAIGGIISAEEAQDAPPMKTVPQSTQPAQSGPTIAERAMAAIEAPTQPVQAPVAVELAFTLHTPGRGEQGYPTEMAFVDAYADLLLAVRRAKSLTQAERRTKMKELEEANLETFLSIDPELAKELHEQRLLHNAALGAEEKEAENG